jgi:hypothetical protein
LLNSSYPVCPYARDIIPKKKAFPGISLRKAFFNSNKSKPNDWGKMPCHFGRNGSGTVYAMQTHANLTKRFEENRPGMYIKP